MKDDDLTVVQVHVIAGEATDLDGYGGTVHGAIASGKRAAAQILAGNTIGDNV